MDFLSVRRALSVDTTGTKETLRRWWDVGSHSSRGLPGVFEVTSLSVRVRVDTGTPGVGPKRWDVGCTPSPW